MNENTVPATNPYNNATALKDLLKMMRRKEILTISFLLDKYGYEAVRIESKVVDELNLQISNALFTWLTYYLKNGEIGEPIPSATDGLFYGTSLNSNDFAQDILQQYLQNEDELSHIHVVPEVVDKPDRLTVTFGYRFGILVFKIKRSAEILEVLAEKGY